MKSVYYFLILVLLALRVWSTILQGNFQRKNKKFQSSATTEDVHASSLVRCSSACLSRSNCDGYESPSGGTCKLHFSPVTLVDDPASSVYVLIRPTFVEYTNGRWVRTQKLDTPLTWPEALLNCQEPDFPNVQFFVPKSVEDVAYMIAQHRATTDADGDKYWLGLNDKLDETQSGIGTWNWVDGTVVNDVYGLVFRTGQTFGDDKDDKDYCAFKIVNDVTELKFEKDDFKANGYICEATILP